MQITVRISRLHIPIPYIFTESPYNVLNHSIEILCKLDFFSSQFVSIFIREICVTILLSAINHCLIYFSQVSSITL